MKFYQFQYTVVVPNNKFIIQEARGTIRTETKLFSSRKVLEKKIKQWTTQGWVYSLTKSDRLHNNSVVPEIYKISDKPSLFTGFDEYDVHWLTKVTV